MKKSIFIIAVGIFVFTACNSGSSKNEHHSSHAVEASSGHESEHAMLTVQGSCDMCKERIENAAKGIDGVSSAIWDQKDSQLHLNFDAAKTSLADISKAIAKVGHDTNLDKAGDDTYNSLPGCCQYRK